MTNIKYLIFYGSWFVFPLLYILVENEYYFLAFLSLLFMYARFIEPKILLVHHYQIKTGFKAKYALISDIHLGVYTDATILQKIVTKVQTLKVDALLIAGDFTDSIQKEKLKKLFDAFRELKIPIYAVLGNHDCNCENPDTLIQDDVTLALENAGVQVLTNTAVTLHDITILGLGSHRAKEDDISLLHRYTKEDKLIVLTHNPDTVLRYPPASPAKLTLVGHTHGGQVRIPFIYKYIIPIQGKVLWDQGLYHYRDNQVFVTSGIGTVGLPLRFFIPPTIDVLELYD